jgi:hypothetical protein
MRYALPRTIMITSDTISRRRVSSTGDQKLENPIDKPMLARSKSSLYLFLSLYNIIIKSPKCLSAQIVEAELRETEGRHAGP